MPSGTGNTSIHSHLTHISEEPDGGASSGNASIPGPDDKGTFKKFSLNIIVGNLESPTVIPKMITTPGRVIAPKMGAVFYNTQGVNLLGITQQALQNMIKN